MTVHHESICPTQTKMTKQQRDCTNHRHTHTHTHDTVPTRSRPHRYPFPNRRYQRHSQLEASSHPRRIHIHQRIHAERAGKKRYTRAPNTIISDCTKSTKGGWKGEQRDAKHSAKESMWQRLADTHSHTSRVQACFVFPKGMRVYSPHTYRYLRRTCPAPAPA